MLGAGVAGLAAARDLARASLDVTVLEARDRPGGRVWSQQVAGAPRAFEMGAEFVHSRERGLSSLLRQADLHRVNVGWRFWWSDKQGVRRRDGGWEHLERFLERIPKGSTGSYASWRRTVGDSQQARLADNFVRGFHAAPVERMSASVLRASMDEEDEDAFLDGPYDALVSTLVDQLQMAGGSLRLGQAARRVRWRPGHVNVEAGGAEWTAHAAVIAVPLGVLRAPSGPSAIRFEPGLGAHADLLRRIEPGHVVRVTLWLRADAWRTGPIPAPMRRDDGLEFGFLQSPTAEFPVWWARPPHPILVGWSGGPAAKRLAGKSPEAIARRAIASLAAALHRPSSEVQDLVVAVRTHDWSTDPWTLGAYSYATAGAEGVPALLADPVGQTLAFAGEHTAALQDLGTVHGALSSGRRAARQVRSFLGAEGRRATGPPRRRRAG